MPIIVIANWTVCNALKQLVDDIIGFRYLSGMGRSTSRPLLRETLDLFEYGVGTCFQIDDIQPKLIDNSHRAKEESTNDN